MSLTEVSRTKHSRMSIVPGCFHFFFGVLIHQGEQSYDPVIPALLPGIPWDLGMAVRTPVLFGLAVSVKNPLLDPGVENESLV